MTFSNIDLGARISAPAFGHDDHRGEPVLVTPCERHAGGTTRALDEHVFASHATFDWRSSNVTVPTRDGRVLRYKSIRHTVRFACASLPHDVRPADRIVRTWDATSFEVVGVRADGRDHVVCDLVERTRQRTH